MNGSDSNQAGTFSFIRFIKIMKGFYHQRSRINTVNSLMSLTPVAGFSMNTDFHAIDHSRSLSLMHCHSKRLIHRIMKHEKNIWFSIKGACCQHSLRTLTDFFGRFKKEPHPHWKRLSLFCQNPRQHQRRSHDAIMATGMHDSGIFRCVRQSGLFLYRKCIQLCTKHNLLFAGKSCLILTGMLRNDPRRLHNPKPIA